MGNGTALIGVLVTVMVIVIIIDNKSNFFEKFFKRYLSKTQERFAKLEKTIEGEREAIVNSIIGSYDDFKPKAMSIPKADNRKQWLLAVRISIMELIGEFQASTLKSSTDYTNVLRNKLKQIKNAPLREYAPFSVLLYSILLLFFDELYSSYPSSSDFILLFTAILTIFLGVFYSALWIKFVLEARLVFGPVPKHRVHKNKLDFRKGWRLPAAFLGVLSFLTAFLILPFVFWAVQPASHVFLIVFTALEVIIIGFFAWHFCRIKVAYGQYSMIFAFFHGLFIGGLSLLVFFILRWSPIYNDLIWALWQNQRAVKLLIEVFVLFYGIVAPYLFSILANKEVIYEAEKESERRLCELRDNYEKAKDEFEKKLQIEYEKFSV